MSAIKSDILSRIDGLFVGYLDEEELEIFNEACANGAARRSYEGAAALLGVARVRVNRPLANSSCEASKNR